MTLPDAEVLSGAAAEPSAPRRGLPLYVWVILAVVLAVPVGLLLGADASWAARLPGWLTGVLTAFAVGLDLIPQLIIRALGALGGPLILWAIVSAIVTNDIEGRQGARMMGFYVVNTVVAIVIGLTLSNVVQPGEGARLDAPAAGQDRLINVLAPVAPAKPPAAPKDVVGLVDDLVPRSFAEARAKNNLAQLVLLALAFGIGLAKVRNVQRARGQTAYAAAVDLATVMFDVAMRVLMWVVALVPLAVFGVVATTVARQGAAPFRSLGWFIVVVAVGLACQVAWYLVALAGYGRMPPWRFLGATPDVVAATFSTSSTAAAMPFTLEALTQRLRISRGSSQLAACVGTNFNNDGTALYQATAALFFSQALGADLSAGQQVLLVLTTMVASFGAGGIPSGSFVVMPLIFAAAGLPADRLPILLTVDWLLDRFRTTSNVLGDMTVAVLLERTAGAGEPAPAPASPGA